MCSLHWVTAGCRHTLRRFACDELSMSANTPLSAIADRIAHDGRVADEASLRGLFRELDDAAYGAQGIDLRRWKRSFSRRFRRVLSNGKRDIERGRDMGLPKLNP